MKKIIIPAGLLFFFTGIASTQSASNHTDNITISAKHKSEEGIELKWVLSNRFEKASTNKLTGFKVYRSNQPKKEFILLTTDLLSQHSRIYYDKNYLDNSRNFYKVVAYDNNGNKIVSTPAPPVVISTNLLNPQKNLLPSTSKKRDAQTEILEKELDDIVVNKKKATPFKSEFKSVKTSLNIVDITFAKAKAKDFNRVELSRKSLDGRRWHLIHTIKGDLNKEDYINYRDHKIEPGREYIYRLQTIDNNGLKSPFVLSSSVKTINRVEVSNVQKVSAKRANGHVEVSWNYALSNDMFFIVYRTFEDGTLRQLGRSETTSFTDRRPPKGTVSYAVKPMRKDGNRGKISGVVVVR